VIRLLGLCGSLRQASLNAMLLRVMQQVAPERIEVSLYNGMAGLPLFNPDLEATLPVQVESLRAQLNAADGVIIASPEYAHGISGVLKNALDWMVGNESFVNKPVMLVNTSPRAGHAVAALMEVLITMSARVIDNDVFTIPLLGSGLNEQMLVSDPEQVRAIRAALSRFSQRVASPD